MFQYNSWTRLKIYYINFSASNIDNNTPIQYVVQKRWIIRLGFLLHLLL